MRRIILQKGKLRLTQKILGFIEKRVTSFGTGAKVDCPREYMGKRVYLVVCDD